MVLCAPCSPPLRPRAQRRRAATDWVHEVKWDGMRVLADVTDGAVAPDLPDRVGRHRDVPRAGRAGATWWPTGCWTARWWRFADGKPDFGALAERMHVKDARRAAALAQRFPVIVRGLRRAAAVRRRRCSDAVSTSAGTPWSGSSSASPGRGPWQVPGRVRRRGRAAGSHQGQRPGGHRQQAAQLDVPAGRRSRDWVKRAHRSTQTCVVGGWRPADRDVVRGGRPAGRSAGRRRAAELPRAGSARGIGPTASAELLSGRWTRWPATTPRSRDDVPAVDARGTHWVAADGVRRGRAPRLRPPAGGCASRPGAACGPTSGWRSWSVSPDRGRRPPGPGRDRRPPAEAEQPGQGALPGRPARPRPRSSTTTPGSRR